MRDFSPAILLPHPLPRAGSRFFPAPWQDKRLIPVGPIPGQFDMFGSNADVFVVRFVPPSSADWNPRIDATTRPMLPVPMFRMWMSLRWPYNAPFGLQAIASADSLDGITGWQLNEQVYNRFTSGQVIPDMGPERKGNETFSAAWNPKAQRWYAYYTAFPGELVLGPGEMGRWFDIYLATTRDPNGLVGWERQGVVLSPESPDTWEGGRWFVPLEQRRGGGLSEPSVLFDPSRDRFLMWYANIVRPVRPEPRRAQIGFATSVDGRVWQKDASNPVLRLGPPGAWDDGGVTHCHVVQDPADGFHMFYHGNGTASSPGGGIGHAYSLDGIRWAKSPANPILKPPAPAPGAETATQWLGPAALIVESKWRLYYWRRQIQNSAPFGQVGPAQIGYAEAPRRM